MIDPDDLCTLCVSAAVALVTLLVGWFNLSRGDQVRACQSCATWLETRGLAADVEALPPKALRA